MVGFFVGLVLRFMMPLRCRVCPTCHVAEANAEEGVLVDVLEVEEVHVEVVPEGCAVGERRRRVRPAEGAA